jgi:NADH dehydrogenase (ubiquinone) 1 alpha subcomplex subunit 13
LKLGEALTPNCYSELEREKVWGRIHVYPLLQAELDREWIRQLRNAKQQESEIMKNVKGWNVDASVYHGENELLPR